MPTSNFTFCAWVNLVSISQMSRIIDFGNGPGIDNIVIGWYSTSSRIFAYFYNGGSVVFQMYSSYGLNLSTWYHFAFVFNYQTGSFYINGKLDSSNISSISLKSIIRTYNYIGKSNWAADYLPNAIYDEIKIFDRALSDIEILNEYNK